jgi:hypothetical protein
MIRALLLTCRDILAMIGLAAVLMIAFRNAIGGELPVRFVSGKPEIRCSAPAQRTLDDDGYALWCDDATVHRDGFE